MDFSETHGTDNTITPDRLREHLQPLKRGARRHDGLLELHEFYTGRAEITKRLIAEKGFKAVVVEADWPDALRLNRYVHGFGDDQDAAAALSGFRRFPAWRTREAPETYPSSV